MCKVIIRAFVASNLQVSLDAPSSGEHHGAGEVLNCLLLLTCLRRWIGEANCCLEHTTGACAARHSCLSILLLQIFPFVKTKLHLARHAFSRLVLALTLSHHSRFCHVDLQEKETLCNISPPSMQFLPSRQLLEDCLPKSDSND